MKRITVPFVILITQIILALSETALGEVNDPKSLPLKSMTKTISVLTERTLSGKHQSAEQGHKWLRSQQGKTGLIRSYNVRGDDSAWTYDQALAIIAFLTVGDVSSARRCADSMLKIRGRDKECKAWADGYNICTTEAQAKSVAVGPNAWMGLALVKLYEATKEYKYLSAAEKIGEFVLVLQSKKGRTTGSVPGGYNQNGKPFRWTGTEHNADCIAFLAALASSTGKERYRIAAIKIVEWLDREMWNEKEGYYYPGYEDNDCNNPRISGFPERLDSQTWTILAMYGADEWLNISEEAMKLLHNGLPWIDEHLSKVSYRNEELAGFSKITLGDRATASFWAEGTAGYLLAAKRMNHDNSDIGLILQSLRSLQGTDGLVPYSIGVSCPNVLKQFQASDLVVADFEAHPNRLWGNVGVYGDAEPDWVAIHEVGFSEPYSWYYEPDKPGYDKGNVHSGFQSFRLVNAGPMCKYKRQRWATLGLDLGPILGCKSIKPVDVSAYTKLSFWAKTDNPEGAILKVIFRDRHNRSYDPQAVPKPSQLSKEWQQFTIDLNDIRPVVDLVHLTHVALAFGKDAGNTAGTIIYVDDIAFTGSDAKTSVSNGKQMPAVFPQHWPYGSVAGTAWLIFTDLDMNPFGRYKAHSLSAIDGYISPHPQEDYCQRYSPICPVFRDWLTFSANLDASYRKTQFYNNDDHAKVFSWDTRVDLWLPPSRDEFSWGPYFRLQGITSNKDYEWENNWGARPGFGFQIYPFSSRRLKEESEIYCNLAKLLGPVHLFAEHNTVRYRGSEHAWRPDELVRIGADYWKEWNVQDITKPWWCENWNGLVWHSTNGFDKDYDTLIFANALRLGVRKTNAGLFSMFTPYLAAESSLSENGKYFWENRLLLGGGIRFTPPLKLLPPELNITRFVVYAEYLHATAYYRSSASSSVPDHDFRVGINIYIGEWWHQ